MTVFISVVLLLLLAVPIWALVRIASLSDRNETLSRRLHLVELQLQKLTAQSKSTVAPFSAESPTFVPAPTLPVLPAEPPPLTETTLVEPPSLFTATQTPVPPAEPPPIIFSNEVPPPIPALPPPLLPSPPAARNIGWEQFMGAKLFAWLGGLAAFLSVAFFIKYSFEHELVPPAMRATLGFIFGIGLAVGGWLVPRPRYTTLAQTLCATGIVVLYAVTFACNAIYHFVPFGTFFTFVCMTLITAAAFGLAVRLDAKVVAVLGWLGGFLTPILLSASRDNTLGLFGYLAFLDVGLLAVALYRHWHFVVPLAAAGTGLMQIAWAIKFLRADTVTTAMTICLTFIGLFLTAYFAARRRSADETDRSAAFPGAPSSNHGRRTLAFAGSSIALSLLALGFAGIFIGDESIAARPWWWFGFILLVDAALLAIAWWDEALSWLHVVAGLCVFSLLALWTHTRLTTELLPWALGLDLLYAGLHASFPPLLARRRPGATTTWWSQLFPPLTLLLMMLPLFQLDQGSWLLWPAILLIDLGAIALALLSASLVVVVVVLFLTFATAGLWLFQMPPSSDHATSLLLVIAAFASVFFGAGIFLARRLGEPTGAGQSENGFARGQPLPAFSALLPFVLLIMITQRLPSLNPDPVFGVALLLVGLTLGLTVALRLAWLPACALVGVAALEYSWHLRSFPPHDASQILSWYLGFHAVFAVFPFVFRRRLATLTGPWAIAALSGVATFPLADRVIKTNWPGDYPGWVPLVFALPPLLSLYAIARYTSPDPTHRTRLNQLAWFGGVALLFLTLIIPIQFSRQWITVGWALEGAALLWLFHRIPHPGLKGTGVVLLGAAFVRLAFNPAVLAYHDDRGVAWLNWYLYSFGVVIAALFVGARLVIPGERQLGVPLRGLFNTLGTILAFLLLNIQIADFFRPPGARVLTFEFSGNFARDMSYTIAWALFALALLLLSIWKKLKPGRIAALTLLGVTVLKLFLHDLERLGALYRIGALFAVAVIAILASFAYQRFLPGRDADDG